MNCSFCGHTDTRVVDSRLISGGTQIRRRRLCSQCGERMTTIETVCHTLPRVIKQTGERETFSEEKLRTGVIRALDKRAVAADDVEAMFAAIMSELSRMGEREIPSARLGDMVMDKLKLLDPVAYVRFASVYRCFQDVADFHAAIESLERFSRSETETKEVSEEDHENSGGQHVHGTC
ncbi:MAG TPA: transcriptional regulator NrdR [Gammaproteobacteria bacterium]|nr:transcriptional regulator NrdR [Gammaproteobacteria bacterium]MEC8010237.1 transcriptional regulator NrdR [Pseudomonadota bacterium]HCK92253.1 transcriptional regulator NrdR [Gammaproteobacteria bacterium]